MIYLIPLLLMLFMLSLLSVITLIIFIYAAKILQRYIPTKRNAEKFLFWCIIFCPWARAASPSLASSLFALPRFRRIC